MLFFSSVQFSSVQFSSVQFGCFRFSSEVHIFYIDCIHTSKSSGIVLSFFQILFNYSVTERENGQLSSKDHAKAAV